MSKPAIPSENRAAQKANWLWMRASVALLAAAAAALALAK